MNFFKPDDFNPTNSMIYADMKYASEAAKIANTKRDEALEEAKAVIKAYSKAIELLEALGHGPGSNSAELWLKLYGGEK